MQILVLGGDGYLGWPTALHLSALGHEVAVVDNFARRDYDEEMGVESLVPIATLDERIAAWPKSRQDDQVLRGRPVRWRVRPQHGRRLRPGHHRPLRRAALRPVLDDGSGARGLHPDEQHGGQPQRAVRDRDTTSTSTWSSSGRWASTAPRTSTSRRGGSRSSTGAGRTASCTRSGPAPFTTSPRCTTATTSSSPAASGGCAPPTSIRASSTAPTPSETELDPRLATRFDYDGVFGTVLNRIVIQAVLGHPLTVYGNGWPDPRADQHRATPSSASGSPRRIRRTGGEFRVFNQFTEQMSVRRSPRRSPRRSLANARSSRSRTRASRPRITTTTPSARRWWTSGSSRRCCRWP